MEILILSLFLVYAFIITLPWSLIIVAVLALFFLSGVALRMERADHSPIVVLATATALIFAILAIAFVMGTPFLLGAQ